MSRLTGKEVYSLMEAYQQVYAPQELTEEQVWEGVENWVHSLLEEGYDLSDYTWEEMYESYLSELTYPDGPAIPTPKPKPIPSSKYTYTPKDLGAKQFADFKAGGGNASVGDSYTAADVVARGRAAKAAALKAVPSSKYTYTPKDLGKKQYADFKFGGGNASVGDSYTAADVVARGRAAKAAAPPSFTKKPIMASFDMFDVVLGHLIDEGYANTYEAAEVIMVNMSEDWRQSIISEGPNYDKNRQRAAQRAAARNEARKAGKTGAVPGVGYVTPRPERETYRDADGVERHTSGARMPKENK